MAHQSEEGDMADMMGAGAWMFEDIPIMDAPGVFRPSPPPHVVAHHQQWPSGHYHAPTQYNPQAAMHPPQHHLQVHQAPMRAQRADGQLLDPQAGIIPGIPSNHANAAGFSQHLQPGQHFDRGSPSPRSWAEVAQLPVQHAQRRMSGDQTIDPALLSRPQHVYSHLVPPSPHPQFPTWAERVQQPRPGPNQLSHFAPPSPQTSNPVQARWSSRYGRRRSVQGRSVRQPRLDYVPLPPVEPTYRLNMRDDTPLDQYMQQNFLNGDLSFDAGRTGQRNRAALMAGWLGETRSTQERLVPPPVDLPMSPTLRSPAPSVMSGHSERSNSNRRIRRERSGYGCAGCPENFPSTEQLRKHIEHVHKGYESRPYACLLCWKRFWYPKDLDRHQETHKPRDQRQGKYRCENVQCEYSVKGFARKDGLTRHRSTCSHSRADSGVGGIMMSRSTTAQTFSTRA